MLRSDKWRRQIVTFTVAGRSRAQSRRSRLEWQALHAVHRSVDVVGQLQELCSVSKASLLILR